MTFRNLMQVGAMGAALAVSAGAQTYDPRYDGRPPYEGRAQRRDIERDLRRRDELARIVEADRRAVERERYESRRANWYNAGHERRELRRAEERLERDSRHLRELDEHIARDMNRWR